MNKPKNTPIQLEVDRFPKESVSSILFLFVGLNIILPIMLSFIVIVKPFNKLMVDGWDSVSFSIKYLNTFSVKIIILLFIFIACISIIMMLLEKVAILLKYDKSYTWFLKHVIIISAIFTFSFSIYYWISFKINSNGWRIDGGLREIEFFDFVYYSFMTFSTIGYGDIESVSKFNKLITIAESIMSISVFIFILAGFNDVKESLKKSSPFAISNKNLDKS